MITHADVKKNSSEAKEYETFKTYYWGNVQDNLNRYAEKDWRPILLTVEQGYFYVVLERDKQPEVKSDEA